MILELLPELKTLLPINIPCYIRRIKNKVYLTFYHERQDILLFLKYLFKVFGAEGDIKGNKLTIKYEFDNEEDAKNYSDYIRSAEQFSNQLIQYLVELTFSSSTQNVP